MFYLSIIFFLISVVQLVLVAFGVINYDTKKPSERFYVTILCFMFSIAAFDNLQL